MRGLVVGLLGLLVGCAAPPEIGKRGATSENDPAASDAAVTHDDSGSDAPADAPAGQLAEMQPPFDSSAVDSFFAQKLVEAGTPGMSVAVVKGGRVRWAKGYGVANIETRSPATKDTLFLLASVSKMFTGTALLQVLTERGISLDNDISDSLGFSVRHPKFPDDAITFRMVLTHTASIFDDDGTLETFDTDATESLDSYVRRTITQPIEWSENKPGSAYEYSNLGFTMAALLVEKITKMDFETYSQKRLFAPLGMNESSWFFSKLDPSHVAMPYEQDATTSTFVPRGHYSWTTWPAGHLQTSAVQLGRYLAMLTNRGERAGSRILPATVVDDMVREQIPTINPGQGLVMMANVIADRFVMGHSGGFIGVGTNMDYDPDTGAGFVLLTNGSSYYNESELERSGEPAIKGQEEALNAVQEKLLGIAESLP